MTLLEKVKAIFAATDITPVPDVIFVKTDDGKIFLVKSKEVAVDADVILIDESAEQVAVADGDYTLTDGSSISIAAGKITAVTPKAADDASATDATPAVPADSTPVKMTIIKQVSKWSMDVDQDALTVGTLLTQTYTDDNGVVGDPSPVQAGEYEMENGDTIQVNSDGIIVLVTTDAEEDATEGAVAPDATAAPDANAVAMSALNTEIETLKASLISKETEIKLAKENIEKLKKEPAAEPINTKKFEKTDTDKKTNNFQSKVSEILNKK